MMPPIICKLKWNWSTIILHNGRTNSCWKSTRETIDSNNFVDFHNTEKKQAQRQMMLDGQFPPGCHWCEDMEKVGADSDRIVHNIHWGGTADIEESKSTVGKIDVLELYFDNTCNYACIYCTPVLSNTWVNELKKFGPMNIGQTVIEIVDIDRNAYQDRLNMLWKWLPDHITNLKELNVLGGEPLLLTETQDMLDFIDEHPAPELVLTVFSNLGIAEKVIAATISKLEKLVVDKKIKSAKIIASLDAWGEEIKFQRFGIDLALFEKNVKFILSSKVIDFGINATLTCLSIPVLPSLIKKWQEWQDMSGKYFHLSCARVEHNNKHYYLGVEVLPLIVSSSAFEEALTLISINSDSDKSTKQRLTGIYNYIKSQDPNGNVQRMGELKCYLEELSVRRNIDWKLHFPWLVKVLRDV